MDNSLKEKIDSYIEAFLEQDYVKHYFSLKKMLEEDEYYVSLRNQMKEAQKTLALSLGKPEYEENKKKYSSLKKTWDEDPYVINYNSLKEEIWYQFNTLKNQLNQKE